MAGKFQTKNVYVDTEYDNIIIVDPNLVQAEDGSPIQRLVDHEDLIYYANLETKVVPRTKLAVGESLDVINTTIASFIGGDENQNLNFLRPKNKRGSFDTSWSDQITGDLSRAGGGANQTVEQVSTVTNDNGTQRSVFNRNITNYQDTQTLGIKSINLTITSAGVPQVDMTLVDVQGRTLFEQGDNSLYSIFFNLPYPAFFLTLKGYYGKAVRYQLALISFNAKLDQKNGNFDISLKLIGRPSALLFDTIIGYAKTAPKMYKREYFIGGNESSSNQTGVSTTTEKPITTTLGRQKLEEVYAEYEAKKLISPNFPRLSIEDFQYRLQNFENWLNGEKPEVNAQLLQDVYKFRKSLQDLKKEVYDYSLSKYLDVSSPFFINNQIYYPFLSTVKRAEKEKYKTRIQEIIDEYLNENIKKNATFGEGGFYQINKNTPKVPSEIPVNINYENLVKQINIATNGLTEDQYQKTFFIRTGKTFDQDPDAYLKFKANVTSTLVLFTKEIDETGNVVTIPTDFFVFGLDQNKKLIEDEFLFEIDDALKTLALKEQEIEKGLSEGLASVLATSDKGVGFRPTIRNVFAVLFAGCDTFYRLMDNAHTLAWNQRSNPIRTNAILQDGQGVDSKGFVAGVNEENVNVVYPWPQYYVREIDKKGKELYTIQYPGDPQYVNLTKGNIQSVWPEVDFTEQYLFGSSLKLENQDNSIFNNEKNYTSYSQINGIWNNFIQPYTNTAESSILFEILERSYVNANYGKFNRSGADTYQIDKLVADLEGENIKSAISNNVTLIEIFKNLNFKYNSFKSYLENTFLTNWFKYKNNIFATEDIDVQEQFFNEYSIYSVDFLKSQKVKTSSELENKLKEYFKDTKSNEQIFLDTYPLTDVSWLQKNMANGNAISSTNVFNETNKIFTIQPDIKKISRLNKNQEGQEINLFTNEAILENNEVSLQVTNSSGEAVAVNTAETLKQFYEQRLNDLNSFVVTESVINYGNEYSGQVKTKIQTNSLLNTPYFVNSIMEGVEIEKNSGDTPYAALGYIYLNSLPLITTREKLKTQGVVPQSDLEYLAASLTKFSGIHQLPYAWILKYGSIWHRYKKWIETGKDILDDNTIWKNFDASNAWDPTGNTKTKTYQYDSGPIGGVKNITLQTQISGTTPLSIPSNTQTFSVGFYPKVVNSVYRFFTKKDLFSAYTDTEIIKAYSEKNLKIIPNQNVFVADPNIINGYGQTIVKNYFVSMTIENNNEFTTDFNESELIFPSMGQVPFNQATFECFDNDKNEKISLFENESFYNGSVRSLWACSNFGYFDHNKIKKPLPTEYIKKIKTTNEIQNPFDLLNNDSGSEYSSIEEIFAVFNKETLDLFERKFLYFISPKSTTEGNILSSEDWFANLTTPAQPIDLEFKRLFYQIKNLFVLDKEEYQQNGGTSLQMQTFSERVKQFLNYDVILEIKNPGSFNRKVFNEFSDSTNFMPTDIKYVYNPYNNVLPPQLSTTLSKANYSDAWNELQLSVGFSTIQNLDYSGTTSFITDFFKDMDIEFNVDNVKRLSQIIKIYVTNRLKDNSLNKSKFKQSLTEYLTKQERYHANMLNETFAFLNSNLKNIKRVDQQIQSPVNGNVIKLETYSTLKAFNDKWTAGSDLLSRTVFEDFLFLDRTNSDIGDEFTIDVTSKKFRGLLKDNDSKPIIDIVSTILQDNNFIFFAMPAYVNFYNIQKAINEGTDIPYEVPNSLFGTHLNVDYVNSKPKFLCMYVGEPSKHPDSTNENNRFNNDSFDLRKSTNPLRVPQTTDVNKNNSNLITAFNVDFGIQNQNIFSDIQIDMSEKKNTAESFRLEAELANSASGDKVAQQSTSLYNIYKSRSYTCGVTSMGNAMIQPTMYFNLRHVPLFYGPYFIMEVKHKVDDKSFMTEFKGYRVSKYSLPDPDSYLASINKNLLEKLKSEEIKKTNSSWPLATGYTSDPNATVNNSPTLDALGVCSNNVFADYANIPFVNSVSTTLTDDELKDKLINKTENTLLRSYLFGVANVCIGNRVDKDQIFSFNHNLFSYQTSTQYFGSVADFIDQQTCITINNNPTPIISFGDYGTSIDMAIALHEDQMTLVSNLINLNNEPTLPITDQIGKALAQIYITLFESRVGLNSNGDPDYNLIYEKINEKINKGDLKETAFDAYIRIFANAATQFNATI